MKYMLDTNICIYLIKKHSEKLIEKFKSISIGDLCISSVTLSELLFGVEKSQHKQKNKNALQQFTASLLIPAFDEIASHSYGKIRHLLEKKGTPIGSMDLMIAAHAKSLNSIVVTHNTKEFRHIPDLKIENWVSDI